MLTVGGMIADPTIKERIAASAISDLPFVRLDPTIQPFHIKVPRLTRKERAYLDQEMPCADDWEPSEFELSREDIQDYRTIYRYYPIYGELII